MQAVIGSRVNEVPEPVQERSAQVFPAPAPPRAAAPANGLSIAARIAGRAACVAAALAVAGCSGASLNPVDWWHGLQGGPLADTRPPPPNADAAYPNLGSVPPKPSIPDATARGKIASGLVADRANAQYAAGQSPLQAFPPAPVLPPPRLAAGDEQPNATLNAASAPPRGPLGPPQAPLPPTAVTPPRPAPVGRVTSAALPEPAAPAPPAAAPDPGGRAEPAVPPDSPPSPGATAAVTPAAVPPPAPAPSAARPPAAGPSPPARPTAAAPAASLPAENAPGTLPGMPDQPPALPRLAGVALPRETAPTPPPATPVVRAAPAPAAPPGAPVTVAFAPGSAALPQAALPALRQLALRHGAAPISVTGFGEAASSEAAVQSSALPLALARARAIADTLLAAGVPAREIRIGAEAQGSGGAASLVGN